MSPDRNGVFRASAIPVQGSTPVDYVSRAWPGHHPPFLNARAKSLSGGDIRHHGQRSGAGVDDMRSYRSLVIGEMASAGRWRAHQASSLDIHLQSLITSRPSSHGHRRVQPPTRGIGSPSHNSSHGRRPVESYRLCHANQSIALTHAFEDSRFASSLLIACPAAHSLGDEIKP
jgi:hypothetical protein